jgi:hypothetical protein
MSNARSNARSNAPSIALSMLGAMLNAMHERTDGLTYVKLVPLREEALDLRFRDTRKNRGVSSGGGPALSPVAALRARLEAAT